MSLAIDIARTLPVFAARSDADIVALMTGRKRPYEMLGHYLSSGETAVLAFARAAESMLGRVDAETRDAVLQVLDRAVALGAV